MFASDCPRLYSTFGEAGRDSNPAPLFSRIGNRGRAPHFVYHLIHGESQHVRIRSHGFQFLDKEVEVCMAKETIFHKLVKNENSYTQLLRNLMVRDDVFRTEFLSLLFGEQKANHVLAAHVHSQYKLENGGQPDILVLTSSSCLIIEIKTENLTGRTPKQALSSSDSEDDPVTYLHYLQSKSLMGFDTTLVFLLPPAWKHWRDLEDEITQLALDGAKKSVAVKQFSWTEVLSHFRRTDKIGGDAFVKEFLDLVAERFGATGFSKEEIDSMTYDTITLATALKINSLVAETRAKALEVTDATPLQITRDEFGFFFKKNNKWVLYFGCWPSGGDESPHALCFGVDDPTTEVRKAFIRSCEDVYGQVAMERDKWIVGWVPNEDLETSDATRTVWAKLEQVWNAVATVSE